MNNIEELLKNISPEYRLQITFPNRRRVIFPTQENLDTSTVEIPLSMYLGDGYSMYRMGVWKEQKIIILSQIVE